ncbi:hypothetical protein QLQ86_12335 [Halomonas sp. LR5S13]|uniref:hypothetical protein n=1 Tax=Halomonas rhizosphaerae TaxID=3043296 RepID=UPI0024A7F47E|nr:hypothetical protein [Halomonas rhizosphaerae]MDI5921579.1 hypothetical protein [Halomonas rhizosphaerae]
MRLGQPPKTYPTIHQDIQRIALLAAHHRIEAVTAHAYRLDAVDPAQPVAGRRRRIGVVMVPCSLESLYTSREY